MAAETSQTGTGAARWGKVAIFAAQPEAELARQQLEASDIPVAVLNDGTGIFGPGFSGRSHLGVTLLVPVDLVEEARELLEDFLDAFGAEIPEEE